MTGDSTAWRRACTVVAHLLPVEQSSVLLRHDTAAVSGRAEPVVIIGGAVLDVQAWPAVAPRGGTTVPGLVKQIPGGVARNIAAVLAALLHPSRGPPPLLVTALGEDSPGHLLLSHLRCVLLFSLSVLRTRVLTYMSRRRRELGMPTDGVRVCPGGATPCVCAVFGADGGGDIVAAVAACDLVEQELTADWVARFRRDIKRAPLVVLDANTAPDALLAAARLAADDRVPVFIEPVSVAKACRAVPALRYATWVSPNSAELLAIAAELDASFARQASASAQQQFTSLSDALQALRPAIEAVLHAGVRHIITTLGPAGVLLSSRDPAACAPSHWALPAAPVLQVVSTAGAGDALVAGTVAALTTHAAGSGITSVAAVRSALATGTAAAAVVVQHKDNAPPREAFAGVLLASAAAAQQQRAGYVLA